MRTCEACQRRAPNQVDEELYPTLVSALFYCLGLDIIHMERDEGKRYIVMLRDYLSGWPEGKALATAILKNVAAFIYEWIVRFGVPRKIICDGGPENQGWVKELAESYKIQKIEIAAYHSQSNGLVE